MKTIPTRSGWSLLAFVSLVTATLAIGRQATATELSLTGDAKLILATVAQGQKLLGQEDEFTKQLTRFDLEARLKTRDDATVPRLLEHITQEVRPWTEAETRQVSQALASFREALAGYRPDLFPAKVWMIKTSGADEGGAAYCRGDAVILPQNMIDRPPGGSLAKLLAHELFHILSRQNVQLRREMYKIVGFTLIEPLELPPSLAARKITNPDAPLVNCFIELIHNRATFYGAPLLYANAPRFDPTRGGTFFDYMEFGLLEVERQGDTWQPKLKEGEPVLLDPAQNASYFEQIGRNTGYIIHPEEILAENFAHLVTGKQDLPSPEILKRLAALLKRAE